MRNWRKWWTRGLWRGVQMIACASLARDVPRRNFLSFSLVSGEKEYNRESDWPTLAFPVCPKNIWAAVPSPIESHLGWVSRDLPF